MIKITFPDGSVREYNEGVTGLQIAESISSRLAQDVLACGGTVKRLIYLALSMKMQTLFFINGKMNRANMLSGILGAHLLAEALQELYPGIQFGIGPALKTVLL